MHPFCVRVLQEYTTQDFDLKLFATDLFSKTASPLFAFRPAINLSVAFFLKIKLTNFFRCFVKDHFCPLPLRVSPFFYFLRERSIRNQSETLISMCGTVYS